MSAEIGLIGLGTMGAALSMNIADNGFKIAVFNRTASATTAFYEGAGDLAANIVPCAQIEAFVAALDRPRNIILMVPAGGPVDAMIAQLTPLLDKDDLIIDAGNANFHETMRRAADAEAGPLKFLGIGVSGGEEGARFGPSIMAGGDLAAYGRVEHILKAISAKHEGEDCAAYCGPSGAGHFVKTVHNGIEYADMQMIAETYGIMRDAMGMDAGAIGAVFARWNEGPLKSYLIEISAKVADARDPESGNWMLDMILDRAGQKGTGRWTAIEALHLASPATVIEAAVAARNISSRIEERAQGSEIFGSSIEPISADNDTIEALEQALLCGKIACYAQGFSLLAAASDQNDWDLPMGEVAKVWRAGCIIRSSMLDDMSTAVAQDPSRNLLFAPHFSDLMRQTQSALRKVVAMGVTAGVAMPALSSGLAYFDQMRAARGTANILQGQRDFFGAHTFERVDKPGMHRGPWGDK